MSTHRFEDRLRSDHLVLYFGSLEDSGHVLHHPDGRTSLHPTQLAADFPWSIGLLDGGLLQNGHVRDRPDGRVFWTLGGVAPLWHAFYWWDRSGDSRAGSNSGLYVRGFDPAEEVEAFDCALAAWPEVVERQRHSLVLVR